MKRLSIIIYFLLLIYSFESFGQTVTLPDKTAFKCETISFPIVAAGFPTNMGAVDMFISINPAVLTYLNYTPGTLPADYVIYNSGDQSVNISWAGFSPVNINGTMLTLNFTYLGGNSNLAFLPACEFNTLPLPGEQIFPTLDDGTAGPILSVAYHVDGTVGSSGNGLSWASPFKTIGEATGLTLKSGDSVLVKPATYNETITIKSNGKELVPLKYNVSVSDTNKITFPTGTDLGCIDLSNHAGQFYAYVFRSWKGNNGVYKITQVNTASRYVIVENAEFKAESGAAGDSSLLQASVGQPIFYLKYATNPETQRVIINATSVPTIKSVCYIGTPSGSGDDVSAPANYNLIDGWDLTSNASLPGLSGLRIVGSKYNVYTNSRVYELDSTAVLLMGNLATSHPCNYNMILDNKIYNTKAWGLRIGILGGTSTTNMVQFTLFKGNEIYSTGSGTRINFQNAVVIYANTAFTDIEKNILRSFNLKSAGKGAIEVWDNARKSLVYGNFIKNINKLANGTNSLVYIRSANNNINVFNNVLLDSIAQNTDIYAFRLTGNNTTANKVVFNTIYNVDNGILFDDSGAGTNDFKLQNNIIYINYLSGGIFFTSTGTTGRFTVSYNCYPITPTAIGQPYNIETGRQVGDPSFLNPSFFLSGSGLSLQSGSICINHGTLVTGISRDHLCRIRNATTPAIGAYEAPITSCAWTGAANQNWYFYKNWDILYVPSQNISVLIPDRTNDPLISSGSAACKLLRVKPGALLKVAPPGTITVFP
jgi:hypothetical protein